MKEPNLAAFRTGCNESLLLHTKVFAVT